MRHITQGLKSLAALVITAVIMLGFMVPIASAHEADAELHATIRAAILSDPRTAEMSEAEIEAMVAALSDEATAQGVTAYDIVWRPQTEEEGAASCNSMPQFFCTLNEAFGFDGSDIAIPIGLGITAAVLLFVIGSILLHRHGHHPVAGNLRSDA